MTKKKLNLFNGLALLLFTVFAQTAQATVTIDNLPPAIHLPSLAPMLDKTMPATINVMVQGLLPPSESKKHHAKSRPRKFEALGSGVIIDPKKGYIVTNAHVVADAKTIIITLNDGSHVNAKLIGADEDSDIAVLQIKPPAPPSMLPSLPIGNSDKLRVGDFVVAVGNPFGLNSFGNSQTVTFGIISALQRSNLDIEGLENFIQTDAAINPGNSGGALINMQGQLIGISTAILAPYYAGNVGIGFAIPINMAIDIMQQIIKYGSIHRGLVGVYVQPLTPELSQAFDLPRGTKGALITQVNPDSPAEKAGLKAGDVIINVNHTRITDASQVKNIIGLLRVGTKANIEVIREGEKTTLDAVVTDAKKHQKQLESNNPFLYGIAMRDFEQESPIHGHVVGIQVVGISESSAGWRAGVQPGDVIVDANHEAVRNLNDLNAIAAHVKDTKDQEGLLVHILRGPASLFVIIK